MLKPEKGNDGAYTGRYYEHQGLVRVAGPFRLVVGRPVFFEEHLVDAAPELERELFRDTEGKHQWGSKLSPPLHTSFVFRNRLQRDEVIVVERLKVCLFDPNGWPLHPDVHSWFEENVRLRVTVNRLDLADELVGRFVGDGYEIQPLTRHVYTVGPSPSPLDFIASDKDITGLLRVLRSPGERGAQRARPHRGPRRLARRAQGGVMEEMEIRKIYSLVDVEERTRTHPTFRIPSREDRDALQPGTLVQLLFQFAAGSRPPFPSPAGIERMWVEVVGARPDAPGVYEGILRNSPLHDGIANGDAVVFQAQHVSLIGTAPDEN